MNRVFVSYSRRNKTFAERIARDLSDAGLEVWVDWRQIQGGELWRNEIYRGLERSEVLVFCVSPESVASEWCRRELFTGRDQGKVIVPVIVVNALEAVKSRDDMRWLLDIQFIDFEGRYEAAFPELLDALPGVRRVGVYDEVSPEEIPNPFKGLEAFQQTDANFFFGRETLIDKSLRRLREEKRTRFLAVVGASGSGKSSLVRAGVIPKIRAGELPGSEMWPVMIFTPGANPNEALATRLLPLLGGARTVEDITRLLRQPESLNQLAGQILSTAPETSRLLLVVDQFEEAFTRAGDAERAAFFNLLHHAVTAPGGRTLVIITMRADFFGRLSQHPDLAELFEQENMVIVTEMTTANLLRAIEGPAQAVGMTYDDGLVERILEDVRRQPGSLPLLQYALKELFERRDGRRLTMAAYEEIGGVQRALAQHAEDIFNSLTPAQQGVARRLLLQLVEVSETGEATRRRADRAELAFKGVSDQAVQEVIDLLTSAESRLLIASREIRSSADEAGEPTIWIDVSHEALIREWDRFKSWVAENVESLRFGSELMKAASDWNRGGRDVAYLLTGTRLARAESWLEHADASGLLREFVKVSVEERQRREEALVAQQARELELQTRAARQLRYLAGVLLVSLVVAIGLTLFALDSSRRAEEAAQRERTAAEQAARNADEARSLALSASAERALSDGNHELALALAVEAVQIDQPPPQAEFTLADVSYAPGVRRRFEGHTGAVQTVAYSPDGRLLLSGGSDNSLILWNPQTGEIVRRLEGHTAPVRSAAFSPDGRVVVSGSEDMTLILWDASSGSIIRQIGANGNGHTGPVRAVAFSLDGREILSGSADQTVIVWDATSGKEIARFTGHTDPVTAVAFSPDGRRAASGTRRSTLALWDAETGNIIRTFTDDEASPKELPTSSILAVAFSPDGSRLLSGSTTGEILVWDVEATERPSRVSVFERDIEQTGGALSAVAFSPDGRFALIGEEESRIGLWNLETSQRILQFSAGVGVIGGAHQGKVTAVAFGGGRFAVSGGEDNAVVLWDIERAELIRTFLIQGASVQAVAFSPDGTTLVSGTASAPTGAEQTLTGTTGDLRSWDVETGRIIQQYAGHAVRVSSVAYNSDGSMLLSGDINGTLILWDSRSGVEIRRFQQLHTDTIYAIAFTPDGKRALSASRDGTLIQWDVATGEMVGSRFEGHEGPVFALAVSPDGRTALSGSADNQIIRWNLETGTEIERYEKHEKDVRAVAFSPDGSLAVSGASDGSLVLWQVESGREIRRFGGHRSAVNGLAFNTAGNLVISGSLDGAISLWDIESGFEIRRYPVGAGVLSLALSPDGLSAATGLSGTEDTLRLWRVLPTDKQLLDWTFANRFVPELGCPERALFRVTPLCGEDQVVPVRTPYPLPTATPVSDERQLVAGREATINTILGDTLNLRQSPGLYTTVVGRLAQGTVVTLLEGPSFADGLDWWRVRAPDGQEGWVVESSENIQTLIPLR